MEEVLWTESRNSVEISWGAGAGTSEEGCPGGCLCFWGCSEHLGFRRTCEGRGRLVSSWLLKSYPDLWAGGGTLYDWCWYFLEHLEGISNPQESWYNYYWQHNPFFSSTFRSHTIVNLLAEPNLETKFYKVGGYKVNMQKSILFLYTNSEKLKIEN